MEPNSTMASSHKAHLPVAEKPDREALLADLNGVDYKEIPVFFEKNELIVYHPRPRRAIARTNPIFTPQGSSSDLSERSNEPVTARNTPTLASTGPVLDSPGIHHDRDTSPDLDFGLSDPEYQHQLSSRRFNQTSGVMTHEETTPEGLGQSFGGLNTGQPGIIVAHKRKYGIGELLNMRLLSNVHPMDLKFSEDAPEHVLNRRFHGSYDSVNTNDSSFLGMSRGGSFEEEDVNRDLAQLEDMIPQAFPIRQPYGPPDTTLHQFHVGFARFIKEHASPLHNRVTAGGRIVPAGPRSPPPTFHIESIDKLLSKVEADGGNDGLRSDKASQEHPKTQGNIQSAENPIDNTQKSFRDIVNQLQGPRQVEQVHTAQKVQLNSTQLNQPQQTVAPAPMNISLYQQPLASQINKPPTLQIPDGAQLIMADSPSSAIISFNGSMVRATLHGSQTFLEPLPQVYPPPVMNAQYGVTGPTPQTIIQIPEASQVQQPYQQVVARPWEVNIINQVQPGVSYEQNLGNLIPFYGGSQYSLRGPIHLQQLFDEQEHYRRQLKTLEKHVAMHATDLSPFHLQRTSQQRRFLVEELDRLRKLIAKVKSQGGAPVYVQQNQDQFPGFQIISPNSVQVSNSMQLIDPARNQDMFAQPKQGYSEQDYGTVRANLANVVGLENVDKVMAVLANNGNGGGMGSTAQNETTRKTLSPDAPDFVPGRTSFATINSSFATENQNPHDQNASVQSTWPTNPGLAPVSVMQWCSSLQNTHRGVKVELEDAAYCDEMGYNNSQAPKMYCSTPAEFEAAIIAARIHAREFGCLGGQSKDPEWDAEQDIRWAMQDKVPIPLPLVFPDFANNPRPWSWEDSFFNVRKSHNPGWVPPMYVRERGIIQMEPGPEVWRPVVKVPTVKFPNVKFPKLRKNKQRHKRTDSWGDEISDTEGTDFMPSESGEDWSSREFHGGFAEATSSSTLIFKSIEKKTHDSKNRATPADLTPVKEAFSTDSTFSTQTLARDQFGDGDASPNPIKDKWLYKPTPTPTRNRSQDDGNGHKSNTGDSILSEPRPVKAMPRLWPDFSYENARLGDLKKVADDGQVEFRTGSPSRSSPWDTPVDNRMSSNEFRTIPIANPANSDQSKDFLKSMLTDKLGLSSTPSENDQRRKKLRKQLSRSSVSTMKDLNARLAKVEASLTENRSGMPETPKAKQARGQKSHKSQHSIALPTYTARAVISSPPPVAASTLHLDNRQGQFAYHPGSNQFGPQTPSVGAPASKSVLYYTGPSSSYASNPSSNIGPYGMSNTVPKLGSGLQQSSRQNVIPTRPARSNGQLSGTFGQSFGPDRQMPTGPAYLPPNQRFPLNNGFGW